MPRDTFDVIVIGLGVMGSAACHSLARRGVSVCGIDQFEAGHSRGSSHGATRVIRKAYFEHPDYVPLLHRAYQLWDDLEKSSGKHLITKCGVLLAGASDSNAIVGLEHCYARHALPHSRMDAQEASNVFQHFRFDPDMSLFFDPEGGYVLAEASVLAFLSEARRYGAAIQTEETVQSWGSGSGGIIVRTARRTIEAASLVITAGPWSFEVLHDLGIPLEIRRKVQLWYQSPNIDFYTRDFPVWFVESPMGAIYGFPAIDEWGVKIAEHSGGERVDTPESLNRTLLPEDDANILGFIGRYLPGFEPRRTRHAVCMYTMTPDEHFILDRHPAHERVVFACGFSGHGFKFAPVVGEILGDLAMTGATAHPVSFLRLDRFAH